AQRPGDSLEMFECGHVFKAPGEAGAAEHEVSLDGPQTREQPRNVEVSTHQGEVSVHGLEVVEASIIVVTKVEVYRARPPEVVEAQRRIVQTGDDRERPVHFGQAREPAKRGVFDGFS